MSGGNGAPVIEVTDLVSGYGGPRSCLRGVSLAGRARRDPRRPRALGLRKARPAQAPGRAARADERFDPPLATRSSASTEDRLGPFLTRIGMLFQGGALIQSLTVLENATLPLREHTSLTPAEIERVRA